MFIKIENSYYNINNILKFYLLNDNLIINFVNNTSAIIYKPSKEVLEKLTKNLLI